MLLVGSVLLFFPCSRFLQHLSGQLEILGWQIRVQRGIFSIPVDSGMGSGWKKFLQTPCAYKKVYKDVYKEYLLVDFG